MSTDGKHRTEIGSDLTATFGAGERSLRWIGIALSVAGLWISMPAFAQDLPLSPAARPDAGRGAAFARHSCAGCHVVGDANFGTDAAPPFQSIANDARIDSDSLRGFLVRPHPPMAPLPLSRIEIEDLVAYFQQLRTHR